MAGTRWKSAAKWWDGGAPRSGAAADGSTDARGGPAPSPAAPRPAWGEAAAAGRREAPPALERRRGRSKPAAQVSEQRAFALAAALPLVVCATSAAACIAVAAAAVVVAAAPQGVAEGRGLGGAGRAVELERRSALAKVRRAAGGRSCRRATGAGTDAVGAGRPAGTRLQRAR
jgi:hypothetical protein